MRFKETFEKQFPKIKNKYNRRIKRCLKLIKNAKIINFIYMQNTWDHMNEMDFSINVDKLNLYLYRLNKKYPNKFFRFLIFEHNENFEKMKFEKTVCNENVIKYISNHKYTENDEKLGCILSIKEILTTDIKQYIE